MNSTPQKKLTDTKKDRFQRLAEPRVTNVLKTLRILGNLSNTSNYRYSNEEVVKIFKAIREQLDLVEKKFDAGAQKEKKEFTW